MKPGRLRNLDWRNIATCLLGIVVPLIPLYQAYLIDFLLFLALCPIHGCLIYFLFPRLLEAIFVLEIGDKVAIPSDPMLLPEKFYLPGIVIEINYAFYNYAEIEYISELTGQLRYCRKRKPDIKRISDEEHAKLCALQALRKPYFS